MYGKGWDLLYEKNILQKLANKVILMLNNFLTYKIEFKRKVYKGFCKNKVETASRYKFEFCIENSSNNGRLSDRIISTFFSGIVPIYLGSVMIEKIIPKNCYISLNQFTTLEKLHNYLSNMSIQKYDNYLKNIEKFINSKRWFSLTADHNVINLIKNIKN